MDVEKEREKVISRGDSHENYKFALLHGKPERHRRIVIEGKSVFDNQCFAEEFGDPTSEHSKVVLEFSQGYFDVLYVEANGDPTGEHKRKVLKTGVGWYNLEFAIINGDPTGEHREVVIKKGTAFDNWEFANFLGKPELHRAAIMNSNDEYTKRLFIEKFGGSKLRIINSLFYIFRGLRWM